MASLANSTFLDMAAWRQTTAATVHEAYVWQADTSYILPSDQTLTVGIMLDRANDPTALLQQEWGTRQASLADQDAVWSAYGADATTYATVRSALEGHGITVLGASDGFVSTAASRTLWMNLDAAQFRWLFSTELRAHGDDRSDPDVVYWNGSLSIDHAWGDAVAAVWVDANNDQAPVRAAAQPVATLPQGQQGIGNALGGMNKFSALFPNEIAALYGFPLLGRDVTTATVGLLEPYIGIQVREDEALNTEELLNEFNERVNEYRARNGITSSAEVYAEVRRYQDYDEGDGDERSLDVGVVASAAPNSTIGIYGGPITASTSLLAYQAAIWDLRNDPGILSSSWGEGIQSSADSPFWRFYDELYVDAALRNVTFFMASGDSGTNGESGNGVPNVGFGQSSPYIVTVGGTSATLADRLAEDATLSSVRALALASDPATLKQLVLGGLKTLPATAVGGALIVETVWNEYLLTRNTLDPGYLINETSSGGIDPRQPVPGYQAAYGLNLVGAGPYADAGRGEPDVSALAGGNMYYKVPNPDMTGLNNYGGGTSAAAPLWAALMAQVQTIFEDQGLPRPGYATDLLYIAAAVLPGAYNDISLGNNVSTYTLGGDTTTYDNDGDPVRITPTGFGYQAGPDYDLATGLGTPNGLLLARALTAIAHAQTSSEAPDLLVDGASAATQHVLVQSYRAEAGTAAVEAGASSVVFGTAATAPLAWTMAMVQKALQADFDPALVRLFDGASQATPHEIALATGDSIMVRVDDAVAVSSRAALTSPFGFVDYRADGGDVVLARSVAVAQTAGGAEAQEAIVRLRSNTVHTDHSLLFYEVDDLLGTVNGIAPGQAGYASAAEARAYRTAAGATAIQVPLDGGYAQIRLAGIDQDDLIAARLSSGGNDFWGFSAANERGPDGRAVTHLWNYGLNTWGWEDLAGGGDEDFNDVLMQIDFTSTAGSQWLA